MKQSPSDAKLPAAQRIGSERWSESGSRQNALCSGRLSWQVGTVVTHTAREPLEHGNFACDPSRVTAELPTLRADSGGKRCRHSMALVLSKRGRQRAPSLLVVVEVDFLGVFL